MNFKINETKQKLHGAYYTPAHIATFLAKWVFERQPKRILEPSCGEGAFFSALRNVGVRPSTTIVSCELVPEEASKAVCLAQNLGFKNVDVFVGDFVSWATSAIKNSEQFDAAIGNLPFVRYQYIDRLIQTRMENLFELLEVPFTRHTNLWVPFILASIRLLREGGRLAFVVPAELLHVLHASAVRDYVAAHCCDIAIVDPTDIWFGETLQGVVLLMAEKRSAGQSVATLEIIPLAERHQLDNRLSDLRVKGNAVSVSALGPKWVPALLSPAERETLAEVASRPKVREFHEIANAEVGIVTGANSFFFVPDDVVEEYDLKKWTRPMMGRSEHVEGVIYDAAQHDRNRARGLPTNFLDFEFPFFSKVPQSLRRYIEVGERDGLHKRYKCRIRNPWYVVPSVHTAPIGLLKRSHNLPRLFLNEFGALTTDTAYRVTPRNVAESALVGSFVNSLTALTAELEGRHYGGGVLELVPSEIERLLVPLVDFTRVELGQLDGFVRKSTDPFALLDRQDNIICKRMGLKKGYFDVLQGAYQQLRARRMRLTLPDPIEEE